MKKGDLIWCGVLLAVVAFLIIPTSHQLFETMTASHPFIMGFLKFGLLATMGELLAIRISLGDYKFPSYFVMRAIVWGIIGMVITLMFNVFAGGVIVSMEKGILPFKGNSLAFAFFTSTVMNLFFGPAFMAYHKFSDTYLDLKAEGKQHIKLSEVTDAVDWQGFVSFTVAKTIPFMWIPLHTIVFMLPEAYRVIAAAFLSIFLGLILSIAKKRSN